MYLLFVGVCDYIFISVPIEIFIQFRKSIEKAKIKSKIIKETLNVTFLQDV